MSHRCLKTRALHVCSFALVAATSCASIWAQTAPASAPAAMPASAPAVLSLPPASMPMTPATLPAAPTSAPATMTATTTPTAPVAELPAVTHPFVATVTADRVYVRSGPSTTNYEVGQLTKGDLVQVVGATKGWYQILPPNGSFCLISKEYVDLDPGNATGTVKGDYINVRAGAAAYKTRDSSVLTVVRKGTKLKILGTQDAYYQVGPPEKAYLYISPQFVKQAPAETAYATPDLKLNPGVKGPSGITVEAQTSVPSVTVVIPTPDAVPTATAPATSPAEAPPAVAEKPAPTPAEPLPPLVPAVKFSETATARFNDVNSRYQTEAKKSIGEQNLTGLLQEFKDILAMENISPSVKSGTDADIAAIDRTMTVQRLVKEQAAAQALTRKQTDALQEQYDSAQRAIAAARQAGPYSAEGMLQTSTIVQGKYALVNPQTGRVVAYVDPASASIDMSLFIGKYIGVRGITKKMENSDLSVIQVSNATLMPTPGSEK